MLYFGADFETTTNKERTEVWLWCFSNVITYKDTTSYKTGTHIDKFIEAIRDEAYFSDITVFFHNLKFDGSFIINYLIRSGIEYDTFINDMGQFYSIEIQGLFGYKVIFRDSLKVLNFTIRQLGDYFGNYSKGETPLLHDRPKEVKPEWIDYIIHDVLILNEGIYSLYYKEGFEKFTSAGEALAEFKKTKIGKRFRQYFPELTKDEDEFTRNAYRGGWSHVKKQIQGKVIKGNIKVYDYNSMYPSVMLMKPLPYGSPEIIKGTRELVEGELGVYKLYIKFKLKPNHLPFIQIKDDFTARMMGVKKTDFIEDTKGDYIPYYCTSVELPVILDHYDCDYQILETHVYKSKLGMFDEYIKKYRKLKEEAPNKVAKLKAKIMLNSLYGKFGSKIYQAVKTTRLEQGILKFDIQDPEEVKPIYVPLSCFITAYAKMDIVTRAQTNYDVFLYSDTDSLHMLVPHDEEADLPLDDKEFGKLAMEGEYVKGKYLRPKLYIEEFSDGTLDVKGAGMTPEIKSQVTFKNFEFGTKFGGKKGSKQTVGGVVIFDTEFTIKKDDFMF